MKGRDPGRTRVVYLAPRARRVVPARGILLGSQRPGAVEVLDFLPVEGRDSRRLLEKRFEWAGLPTAVGVALPRSEFQRCVRARDLAPGDVVLAHLQDGTVEALLNTGRRFNRARLRVSSFYLSSTESPIFT